jgi:hypothetical protein
MTRDVRVGFALVLGCATLASSARASNPLEYPDNGSASFSRGGAWLAVGNEPIAAHYSPAMLAGQASGFSVEQELVFPRTCVDRRGPGNAPTGPDAVGSPDTVYVPVCNARAGFPNAIPSLAIAWRATKRIGLGFAIVPPSTYGSAQGQLPLVTAGMDRKTGAPLTLPAPYRYLQLEQRSTILFPTVSIAYELARHLRVGVGFVSGMGIIDVSTAAVSKLGTSDASGDHMIDDGLSRLRTRDLFVPGVVASIHWSVSHRLDLSVWGRWMDAIRSHDGSADVTLQPFDGDGNPNPPCTGSPKADGTDYTKCTSNQSIPNHFDHALTLFRYPIPPELRWAVRYHSPRSGKTVDEGAREARDPLHDDVFDVELDQSYTWNAAADAITVRFAESGGTGTLITQPAQVPIPPNADRPTGYRNSLGWRVGGQWNAVRDVLGLRAGAWVESRSQDPAFLTVAPVGALRGGFGGGLVVRVASLDVSVGYQRHVSAGLDNGGEGRLKAPAGTGGSPEFNLGNEPPGVSAADRTQFRTVHAVDGGSVSFDAHVVTLGGVVRFE